MGPFGHSTTLHIDDTLSPDGYLTSVTDPLNHSYTFSYAAGGLMTHFTNPRGFTKEYAFDNLGQLIEAKAPSQFGGSKTLTRTDNTADDAYAVNLTRALGATTNYAIDRDGDKQVVWSVTPPGEAATVTTLTNDGSAVTQRPDGGTTTATAKPDPRFGMLSPVGATQVSAAGSTVTASVERSAQLGPSGHPLDVETLTTTTNVNGGVWTRTFDKTASPMTITSQTAALRTSVTELDATGRPTKVTINGSGFAPVQLSYYDGNEPNATPPHAGFLKQVTRDDGVEARAYTFEYDAVGNLHQVLGPLNTQVTMEYDAAGKLSKQTLHGGEHVRFEYDAAGNLLTLAQPGSSWS